MVEVAVVVHMVAVVGMIHQTPSLLSMHQKRVAAVAVAVAVDTTVADIVELQGRMVESYYRQHRY